MPDDGTSSRQSKLLDGLRFLATWSAIGAAILLTGALSTRGLFALRQVDLGMVSLFPDHYKPAVLLFSVCGGLMIGLLFLSWWIAKPGGFGWGMGVIVLSLLLAAIFIWPTPYKYYRTNNPQVLLRVTRVSGHGEIIPREYAPPTVPGEQTRESLKQRLPQQPPEKP